MIARYSLPEFVQEIAWQVANHSGCPGGPGTHRIRMGPGLYTRYQMYVVSLAPWETMDRLMRIGGCPVERDEDMEPWTIRWDGPSGVWREHNFVGCPL